MDRFSITRRAAMAGAVAGAVSAGATALPAGAEPAAAGPARPDTAAQTATVTATATGTVYDAGGGAARPGIPGVLVSNGRDVTETGTDGAWSLPVKDGDTLFVIKPTGWMTETEPGTMLPRFTCHHAPAGSPGDLRFAGLAATGPLPASIDFPLHRQTEPDTFNVVLFTDPQPESEEELGYVRDDVVRRALRDTAQDAAFGITLGDVMFDDLSMYDRHNRIIGTLGLPWYNLPGNHDMNTDASDDRFSKETFKRIYGARHYAWQFGGATFIALDNVEHLEGRTYQGRIGDMQMAFLHNLLAHVPKDQLIVLCMHRAHAHERTPLSGCA